MRKQISFKICRCIVYFSISHNLNYTLFNDICKLCI